MYVFMIVMYAGILFLIAALSLGFLSWLIYQKNKKSKQLKISAKNAVLNRPKSNYTNNFLHWF